MTESSESDARFSRILINSLNDDTSSLDESVAWFPLPSEKMKSNQKLLDDLDLLDATLVKVSVPLMLRFWHFLKNAVEVVESPIEKYMLMGLVIAGYELADGVMLVPSDNPQGMFGHPVLSEVWIEPQAQIGDYRVDFLVTWYDHSFEVDERGRIIPGRKAQKSVVVECDGHAYHEKTKEQARRDKRRDRELQKVGYNVFRYTGSEVWRDALGHAREAVLFLYDWTLKRDQDETQSVDKSPIE